VIFSNDARKDVLLDLEHEVGWEKREELVKFGLIFEGGFCDEEVVVDLKLDL